MRFVRVLAATLSFVLLGGILTAPVAAEAPTMVRGEAILAHPAGKLALRVSELLAAGKVEEAVRLRTAADQAEWKKQPAAERDDSTARIKERAPDPKVLAEGIRKGGVLTLFPDRASLEAPYGAGGEMAAMFSFEKGQWYASLGPMVMAGAPAPAQEVRIAGAEILEHPIYDLALKYSDAVHSGSPEAFLKLASSESKAKWKAEPESERKEITAFYRKMVPKKADLAAGITAGGLLIVEDDAVATLNIVTFESASKEPGVVRSTSSTVAMPFVLEGGQWKVKR